jgi:hypothetical protein
MSVNGVTKQYKQVGKFTDMESENNEDKLYLIGENSVPTDACPWSYPPLVCNEYC